MESVSVDACYVSFGSHGYLGLTSYWSADGPALRGGKNLRVTRRVSCVVTVMCPVCTCETPGNRFSGTGAGGMPCFGAHSGPGITREPGRLIVVAGRVAGVGLPGDYGRKAGTRISLSASAVLDVRGSARLSGHRAFKLPASLCILQPLRRSASWPGRRQTEKHAGI